MVDTFTRSDQNIHADLATLSRFGRFWLLTVAALDVLLVISSMVALNAALPDIAVETAATQTQLTWIVDGYTLVLACLLLPAGAIGDRYGRRGALVAGLAIFAVASIAPVFFDSPVQIILARALAGVGAAFIMPATLSLLTAAFPKSERNKAVGIWAGVASSGAIVGFMGSGLLLQAFNWQSIFYAFAASAVVLIFCTFTISSSRDETATPIDGVGAVLIGSAVAVFVFGVVEAPVRGWTHPLVWGCMAAGVALAVAFGVVELRRRHPLLDVRLFGRPDFATGAIGITILFLANFGFFFIEMQYLQLVLGYSPLQTAFALAPLAVPILILGATMHLYLPRVGLRTAVALGLFLIGVGLFLMRYLDAGSSYLDLVWPMLVTSAGIGLCVAPTTSAIMNAVPTEKQGVASAVNDTTREIGAAVGIAVAGSVLAAQYGTVLSPALASYPEQIRSGALESLANALAIADQMGPQGARLADLATAAFIESMSLSLLVLSLVLAVAAAFVAVWAPGRDGRQFDFARGINERWSGSGDELGGAVTDHDDGRVRAATGDGGKHRAVDHP
ncbi:MFS transporter [Mycolicibacterium moriokaense]|uniref:MFS transporter n=1 Tax=Mycolicibacterium moriokaense TaxID=39691 RepID=A0AAD1HFL6_9MYCO|nr:MFS transporter [Mycolicibacterium moriokaense]MCV7041419.1 MFS transporter [Mycolicibacterium moriokaense]ORB19487.1 MFS transporter [Mycolicibacterium moriokaense]BBX04477.1 MFS transporter [Mycolicibacterium moriokaense]